MLLVTAKAVTSTTTMPVVGAPKPPSPFRLHVLLSSCSVYPFTHTAQASKMPETHEAQLGTWHITVVVVSGTTLLVDVDSTMVAFGPSLGVVGPSLGVVDPSLDDVDSTMVAFGPSLGVVGPSLDVGVAAPDPLSCALTHTTAHTRPTSKASRHHCFRQVRDFLHGMTAKEKVERESEAGVAKSRYTPDCALSL